MSYITEQARASLARQICKTYKDEDNNIYVITLEPGLEQILESSVQSTERGPRLVIRPDMVGQMIQSLTNFVEKMVANGQPPALVCSPTVRYPLRKLLEGPFPNLAILAYSEIIPGINIKTTGTVVLNENENVSG